MKILEQRQDYRRTAQVEDGVLYTRDSQQIDSILKRNAEVRSDGGARSLDWGQPVLNLPLVEWVKLTRQYPDLVHGTPEDRKRRVAQIAKEHPEYCINAKSKYL